MDDKQQSIINLLKSIQATANTISWQLFFLIALAVVVAWRLW
jgi:hypothetical protein